MSQETATKGKKSTQNTVKDTRSETPAPQFTGARVTRRSAQEASNKGEHEANYAEARKHLSTYGILGSMQPCTPQTISNALQELTIVSTKIPANIVKVIQSLSVIIRDMDQHCAGCSRAEKLPEILKEFRSEVLLSIESGLDDINTSINATLGEKLPNPTEASESAGTIEGAVKSLSKVALQFEDVFTKAADSTTQLANTARSYKDALLSKPTDARGSGPPAGRGRQSSAEATEELNAVKERKDRQVLIEVPEEQLLSISTDTIREKAQNAISQISDPPQPADTSIIHVARTRKNGILINFSTKEAAAWLRHPDASHMFTAHFITGSTVIPRHYAILVPRVPTTFDPDEDAHIREVEEANGLEKNVITKARWIKPVYRRKPDQRVAHLSLMFTDPSVANSCIRVGITICNANLYPVKLKQEPAQCMKCRGWGHYANDCKNINSTCGTCGGEHRTGDCTEAGKKFCVSCKSDTHSSWDRNCPEFIKRCAWYDEKHPDNALRYFPTEADWTQEVRPARFPLTERFPSQFAVRSTSPPNRNGRDQPSRAAERQSRRPKNKGIRPAGQTTINSYFSGRNSQGQEQNGDDSSAREEGEVSNELYHSFEQSDYAGTASTTDYTGWT